jgi:predicted TIM-barrel fold metal-dependent hydrolase
VAEVEVIPIIDSLAHPTLSGHWLGRDVDATFATLVKKMDGAGFVGACAIGMADIEGYSHDAFMGQCQQHDCLIPIAGINPNTSIQLNDELDLITDIGFRGIKIHPRLSDMTQRLEELQEIFKEAARRNLVIFYCTYMHCDVAKYPEIDPFYSLIKLLRNSPSTKVILVHGGDVSLMKYAELVRFNDQLLLDLSLTFMKYTGSSIDLDIKFLFREFDRRICIGTDHPEYSHDDVRNRFDKLAKDIDKNKGENIGHLNIQRFIGLQG